MTIYTTTHGTATPERNDEMTKAPKQIWLNKQGTAVVPAGVSIWENVDVLYIRADQVDAREAQASAEGFDRGVKEAQPIVESLRAELHSLYDAIGFDPLDLENGHDNARAAIDALAEMGGVRVKPLVWDDFEGQGAKASGFYQANYLITKWRGRGEFEVAMSYPGHQTGFDGERFHPTLEAAKAAAQADYEARILAAVETAPVSVREAARVLYDMPETDRMKAWRATRDAPPEFAKWFCIALRAIAEGED